jgi:hypothetical protein
VFLIQSTLALHVAAAAAAHLPVCALLPALVLNRCRSEMLIAQIHRTLPSCAPAENGLYARGTLLPQKIAPLALQLRLACQ